MNKPLLSLEEIREGISDIDDKILNLLAKRREFSLEVAKNKIQIEKPIRDIEREQLLLESLIAKGIKKELDSQYVTKIFYSIIEDSVLYQQAFLQTLLNPNNELPLTRVSLLGGKGSYSHLAARNFFSRRHTKLLEAYCVSFKAVIEEVETGNADYGILPIENTSSGSINEVYDQLQHTRLAIVGEITQQIEHGLLVASETDIAAIKVVYSHPQPHQQCSEFLRTLKGVQAELCSSTAEAMATVAKLKGADIAAIGSIESGELYGLTAIKQGIANQADNYTRFIVVARKSVDVTPLVPAKTTFIMSTAQKAGSLVDCLMVLKKYSINMTKLESRPVIGNPWEEMFYVDVEGNVRTEAMKKALEELTSLTRYLKVLGCYPIENVKPVELE